MIVNTKFRANNKPGKIEINDRAKENSEKQHRLIECNQREIPKICYFTNGTDYKKYLQSTHFIQRRVEEIEISKRET